MRPLEHPALFLLLLLCIALPAKKSHPQSRPDTTSLELSLPQPLTADLSSEIDPAASPDGRWLLYASDRSGNYDLWIRPTGGGVPVQLTTHPADDYSPAWSHRGDRICFVSTRDDPQGDIFILDIKTRGDTPRVLRVRPLIAQPGSQSHPSFSKRSKFLVYQDGSGLDARIMLLRLSNRTISAVSDSGYLEPKFSYQDDRVLCIRIPEEGYGGDICIIHPGDLKAPAPRVEVAYEGSFPAATPCWEPQSRSFAAVLVNEDKDEDGLLTARDGQMLFRFDPADSGFTFRPISIGNADESHPFWAGDGFIYYVSDKRGNPDLWRVPPEGPVPAAPSAETAFHFALSIGQTEEMEGKPLSQQDILSRLLALDRVRRDFPDDRHAGARSMLEAARLLRTSGDFEKSETFLKRIPRLYADQEEICAQASIDYQVEVHGAGFTDIGDFFCENPVSLLSNLTEIVRRFPDQKIASARARYLSGAALEQLGDLEEALRTYDIVVNEYADAQEHAAEALLRIAAIYQKIGSGEEALTTYLVEIKRFPDQTRPTNRAISAIIDLKVHGEDPIAGLQDIINRNEDLPELAAAAQKRIAELLVQAGEIELAIGEYERLRGFTLRHPTPYVRALFAESLISEAQLEDEQDDDLIAQSRLEEVEEKFSDLKDGSIARKARLMRITMYADRAEYLNSIGDWELGLADIENALRLDPDNVRLHRGKIAAANALGRLDEITSRYRQDLSRHPNSPTVLYALGLCFSYFGEKDPSLLEESNHLIQRAIAIRPDLAYGYLTLGYNYERLENLSREKKKPYGSALAASIQAAGKVMDRLGRFVTFQGEPAPFQGYEKAIEILQLGLAINDEKTDPQIEAQMLLNLGNNYFHLGEFGYPRALAAYQKRAEYDETFSSPEQEAIIRERMGEAAAVVGKDDLAAENYKRSLELYHRSKRPEAELRLMLRLAELYQASDAQEESNSYYRQALTLAQKEGMDVPTSKWWENMAYNAFNLGDDPEAIQFSRKALSSLPKAESIPPWEIHNPLVLDVLGIPISLWNFGYLGTGSPMSAMGFSQRDELLLNYSILQDVYTRQKNIPSAIEEAARRLGLALQRHDTEAEALLWSQVGILFWAEGQPIMAQRCFIRSQNLCKANGMRGGYLSALINLACVELSAERSDTSVKDVVSEEIHWFADHNVGVSEEEWAEVRRGLDEDQTEARSARIKRDIHHSPVPDLALQRESLDWNLIRRLLLLDNGTFPDLSELIQRIDDELDRFRQDPIGFKRERVRLYELSANLCMKASTAISDTTLEAQVRRMELQGKALWALKAGVEEARKGGWTDLEIRLRLELSDYLLSIADPEGSTRELMTALGQAKLNGRGDLLWRTYWRFGRNAMDPVSRASASSLDSFGGLWRRPAEEWFELATQIWGNQPEESNDLGILVQSKAEASLMFQFAAQNSINIGDWEQGLAYAQQISNLPLIEATRGRIITPAYERRKFMWGGGGGLIPYLQKELSRLGQQAATLRANSKPDTAAITQIEEEIKATEREYLNSLEKVKGEDPEFASLFSMPTFSQDSLGATLNPGDLCVQILNFEDEIALLLLDRDSLYVFHLPGDLENNRGMRNTAEKRSAVHSDSLQEDSAEFVMGLFGVVRHRLAHVKKLFLIIPPEWSGIPFEQVFKKTFGSANAPQVYRLPSLQSLVFLQSKASLGRGDNLSFISDQSVLGFRPAALDSREEIVKEIDNSGAIFLRPQGGKLSNSLDRKLFTVADKTWMVSDLFETHSDGDVLFIQGGFPDEAMLARVGFFTGFPNVIFIPELPDTALDLFFKAFTEAKRDQFPGRAYYAAIERLAGSGLDYVQLSGFRYYGDGGLDATERQDYARRNFAATVLKGNYNLGQGDGEWALRYYDQALAMSEQTGDSAATMKLHQLRIAAAKKAGRWEEAIHSQKVLNEFYHRAGREEDFESGLRNVSVYYGNGGNLDAAIEARLSAQRSALARGDEIQVAEDAQILATLYERESDYKSAETSILQAQAIFKEWEEFSQYVACIIYQSRLYMQQDNYGDATRLLESAGQLANLPAEYYQHLGLAYEGLTDYDSALQAQMQALVVAGDTISAVSALSHQSLGGIFWKMGRYQDGLDQLKLAGEQFSTLGLQQYAYLTQNTKALIYLSLGDRERALEEAKNALEGAIHSGDVKSSSQIEKNLGLIELADGQAEKAKNRFRRALALDSELGSVRGQAYAYLDLGNAYLQIGELDSAQAALDSALNLGKQLGEDRVRARSLLGLGIVQTRKSNFRNATEDLMQAKIIAGERNLNELGWRIELALARAENLVGKEDNALKAAESAMATVETLRSTIAAEDLRSGFMEDKEEIYTLAVSLLLKQSRISDALDVTERAKSRTFLDILQNGRIDRNAGLDAKTRAEEARLSGAISKLQVEISWLASKGGDRTPEEDELFERHKATNDSLQKAYGRLLEDIESIHPGYREIVAVNPESCEEIQRRLEVGEVLIEYFPLPDVLVIFAVKRDEIRAYTVAIKEDSLKSEVLSLRRRLEKKLSVRGESQALFESLIAPLGESLKDAEHLVIIPNGWLHYLPFALLQDRTGGYLLDKFTLSLAPSASVFAFCRDQSKHKRSMDDPQVLAFGNPSTDLLQESLFFAEKEVESIDFTFPHSRDFLGGQARESALINEGQSADIVHLACHGLFNAPSPIFSTLFLAPGDGENGQLQMFEIFNLHLDRCGLVTLSACESGLGGLSGGDEIIGLSRAFIYAGSPRVISTLWKVDDLASAVLVKHFYRNLKSGMTPTQALQKAQQHVRDRIQAHPAYWAAFQLTGEPGDNGGVLSVNQ